jgi:ADP-ribose pyrophosphatase YjhB (NUDIX family)
MSSSRSPKVSTRYVTLAAAIVIHNDRVLIVRRSKREEFLPQRWGIPCGKVEPRLGESAKEAAVRELHEETRLRGKVLKYVGQQEFSSVWRGRPARNVQYNYLVSLECDENPNRHLSFRFRWWFRKMPRVKTPRRDQDFRWVPLDQVDDQPLDRHNSFAIRQGLNAIGQAVSD